MQFLVLTKSHVKQGCLLFQFQPITLLYKVIFFQKLFDHCCNFDGSKFPHPDVLRRRFFLEWFNYPPGKCSQ